MAKKFSRVKHRELNASVKKSTKVKDKKNIKDNRENLNIIKNTDIIDKEKLTIESNIELTKYDIIDLWDKENSALETTNIPDLENFKSSFAKVGEYLKIFQRGKLPKILTSIASNESYSYLLEYTNPLEWSLNALHKCSKLFISSNDKVATNFIRIIVSPYLRKSLKQKTKIHNILYQVLEICLKKALIFFKIIYFPFLNDDTITLKQWSLICSVVMSVSISADVAAATLSKLTEVDLKNPSKLNFAILCLLKKNHNLPRFVVNKLKTFYFSYFGIKETLTVLWFQSLLLFVQKWNEVLSDEDKEKIKELLKVHHHDSIKIDILKALRC